MNKKQIIASLNKIANELDYSGLYKEATSITNVMTKLAGYSELDMDFSGINFWDEKELGRNIVKSMMKIIADCLKGSALEEEAREEFTGGKLQSLAMALLDESLQDDGHDALMSLHKTRNRYNPIGTGIASPLIDKQEFYNTCRIWKRYKEDQKSKYN